MGGGSKKPRLIKGRLNVRIRGYSGVQKLAPSALIKYIPATKLRLAARRVLIKTKGKGGGSRTGKRRRRGGSRRRRRRVRRTGRRGRMSRRKGAGGGLKKRRRRRRKAR